jgi:hypothetical protein
VYILCRNFNNLCLNSSGAYLYNSELMLSSPEHLPFFVNLTHFLIHLILLRYLNDCWNSILILGHLCLLCSIICNIIAEMHFHLCFLEFLLFLVCLYFICFKILYTLGWVLYVSCSKFLTYLSQEALLYSILSYRFFEFSQIYVICLSFNCSIFSSHIFRYFLLFRLLYFPQTFVCC